MIRGFAIVLVAAMPAVVVQPVEARTLPTDGIECIDFLYGEPSLLGTTPRLLSWSRDSSYLAFVWDAPDDGHEADEIWIYAPSDRRKWRPRGSSEALFPVDQIKALGWLDEKRILVATRDVLYEIDLDDGARRVVSTPPGELGQVGSSPDGERIAIVAGGKLWLSNAAATGLRQFREVYGANRDRIAVESFKWSSDGSSIAFLVADDSASPKRSIRFHQDGRQQVREVTRAFPGESTTRRKFGIFSRDSGEAKWLKGHSPGDLVWSYEWSEQGTSLLIDASDLLARTRRVTAYDIEGESTTTYHASGDNVGTYKPYWSASWAPGGQGVILLSDHEGFYHLYHLKSSDAAPRPLTAGQWEVADFQVDRRNGYVYFTANMDHIADRQLYRVALAGDGSIEQVSKARGTYTPSYSPSFEHLAFLLSDDKTPPDIYYSRLDDVMETERRRVTESPRDAFYEIDWADVEYVQFESQVDGTTLFGRLYTTPDSDARKRPLVVGSVYSDSVRNNWGGRSVHPTWGLDQCFVSGGYLVLAVNVRGSWGQGREFRATLAEFGSTDIDDIESAVRHLVSQGIVDPDKVAIWGSSYGGLMTTMSLFKKPGVYAAGIAGAPATNVFHAFPGEMRVMGPPSGEDFPGRYMRQSSLNYSEGLQDPLMIIHGTRDEVVLYSDSIALAERLMAQGRPFELVTLPGVGHQWDNNDPATTRFAFKKMITFLEQHLDE